MAAGLANFNVSGAVNRSVVAGSYVSIADDDFLEMPARYQPLNPPSDAHRINGGVP